MACRSLLADLNAVKDTPDADGGHFYVDYSFRASALIKAHVVPLHQEDLEQWFVRQQQDGMIGYQVSCSSIAAWHHTIVNLSGCHNFALPALCQCTSVLQGFMLAHLLQTRQTT